MAYGKKNTINTDLSRLILGLLGEPGIGKTTTIYKMAEKEFGEDGTLAFTRFGVPFTYKLNSSATTCSINVDGKIFENEIPKEESLKLFAREGEIKSVSVEIPESFLKNF